MFTCVECNKKTKEKERVFVGNNWCQSCVDKEGQRSLKEDSLSYATFTRPPKYMLQPKDYKKFGY